MTRDRFRVSRDGSLCSRETSSKSHIFQTYVSKFDVLKIATHSFAITAQKNDKIINKKRWKAMKWKLQLENIIYLFLVSFKI